jgi:hypothetical protein
MLNFFRKSPSYVDREFSDLSVMLCEDREDPTYKHDLLDPGKLDFSIESLKHMDEYLETLHTERPQNEDDAVSVVLRCGAYVGEVIRKNSPDELHWVAYKEAARHSAFAKGLEHSVATAGILWKDPENMYFPLAKICKFIENGSEDSVYAFARVILDDPNTGFK